MLQPLWEMKFFFFFSFCNRKGKHDSKREQESMFLQMHARTLMKRITIQQSVFLYL